MKSIAFWNRKGGSTKTTTTVNLAHALTLLGKSVLIFDMDSQSNTSYCFGVRGGKTISDLIFKREKLKDVMIEVRPELYLVQGDLNEEYEDVSDIKSLCEDLFIDLLSKASFFDYVFFDCPPSYTDMHYCILKAIDEIAIPISLDWLPLVGAMQVKRRLARLKKQGIDVHIGMVIPTMHDARVNKTIFVIDGIKESFGQVITRPVKICAKVAEAPFHRMTIYDYDPKCSAANDYLEIAKEMINNGERKRGKC